MQKHVDRLLLPFPLRRSFRRFSLYDLSAIATYFETVPGSGTRAPTPVNHGTVVMQTGRSVYADNCSACDGLAGEGVHGMMPTFTKSASVQAQVTLSLVDAVLHGAGGAATSGNPTGAAMPRFDCKLDDREIANVPTYIRNSFGNAAEAVKEDDVARARAVKTGG